MAGMWAPQPAALPWAAEGSGSRVPHWRQLAESKPLLLSGKQPRSRWGTCRWQSDSDVRWTGRDGWGAPCNEGLWGSSQGTEEKLEQ